MDKEIWAITCNDKIIAVCDDPFIGERHVQAFHSMPLVWNANHFTWDGDLECPKTYRIFIVPFITDEDDNGEII